MDISKIDAFNPNRIDWKRLTAKEIMKYEDRGVEVPDIYLQWAHEFLNAVEEAQNDEVTYEIATAQARHSTDDKENTTQPLPQKPDIAEKRTTHTNNKSQKVSSTQTSPQDNTPTAEETPQTSNEVSENNEEEEKTPQTAAEVRAKLVKEGSSILSLGSSFMELSGAKRQLATTAITIANNIGAISSNEIAQLEQDMQNLMAEIDAAKNEIRDISKHPDNRDSITRINELQARINSLGIEGQTQLSNAELDFSNYDSELSSQEGIGETAQDYGSETISIGEEIVSDNMYWMYRSFGRNVISAGEIASNEGMNAIIARDYAQSTNDESQSKNNALQAELQRASGITITPNLGQNRDDENNQPKDLLNNNFKEKSESDKSIKAAQNDGTDNTDKINTDVNEIIKRKIRRGENLG